MVDQAIEAGIGFEIERCGRRIRIMPVRRKSELARPVTRRGTIIGESEEIVRVDQSREWSEDFHR